MVDNTEAKSQAVQLHNKISKHTIQLSNDQQLQRRVLAPTNPKKILQLSLKNTKDGLRSRRTLEAVAPKPYGGYAALIPRAKRHHSSPVETDIQTPEERRKEVCTELRLPRPVHSRLVYYAIETANVFNDLCSENVRYAPRTFATLVKQNIINTKRVPVHRNSLNL